MFASETSKSALLGMTIKRSQLAHIAETLPLKQHCLALFLNCILSPFFKLSSEKQQCHERNNFFFLFSFKKKQSFRPPTLCFFFSFFISKLSHDDSIDIFLPLWAQQKNHGTMWSTCLPNDEGGRGETPPPRPFLPQTLIKSTNRSIVVAQSALLSCQ